MNLGQIDIQDVLSAIVVLDLAACPVKTFNLHCFSILYGSTERDYSCQLGSALGAQAWYHLDAIYSVSGLA